MTHCNSVPMRSWQRSRTTLQQLGNLQGIPLWMVDDERPMGPWGFDLVERVLTDIVYLWVWLCLLGNSNKCFSFFGPRTSSYIYWVDNWNKMTLASQSIVEFLRFFFFSKSQGQTITSSWAPNELRIIFSLPLIFKYKSLNYLGSC